MVAIPTHWTSMTNTLLLHLWCSCNSIQSGSSKLHHLWSRNSDFPWASKITALHHTVLLTVLQGVHSNQLNGSNVQLIPWLDGYLVWKVFGKVKFPHGTQVSVCERVRLSLAKEKTAFDFPVNLVCNVYLYLQYA